MGKLYNIQSTIINIDKTETKNIGLS